MQRTQRDAERMQELREAKALFESVGVKIFQVCYLYNLLGDRCTLHPTKKKVNWAKRVTSWYLNAQERHN